MAEEETGGEWERWKKRERRRGGGMDNLFLFSSVPSSNKGAVRERERERAEKEATADVEEKIRDRGRGKGTGWEGKVFREGRPNSGHAPVSELTGSVCTSAEQVSQAETKMKLAQDALRAHTHTHNKSITF